MAANLVHSESIEDLKLIIALDAFSEDLVATLKNRGIEVKTLETLISEG
jgi:hypothetical protein